MKIEMETTRILQRGRVFEKKHPCLCHFDTTNTHALCPPLMNKKKAECIKLCDYRHKKEWYFDYIYGLQKNGILITDTKKNGIPQMTIHESMYFGV